MTHPRTQIRSAFVSHLRSAIPSLGNRVYSGRLMPLSDDDDQPPQLPAIMVHTRAPDEIRERSASGWNGFERRRAIVSIMCVAQSNGDIDAELDVIAEQVEAALESWTIPGFESSDPFYLDTIGADPEFEGELTTSAITIRYEVHYNRPYRSCSDPYVDPDADDIMRSGAYPGGQVTPGCPADNTGEACPVAPVELFFQQERIN
jgi:hypothetical protein